jgi:hypothetical protein
MDGRVRAWIDKFGTVSKLEGWLIEAGKSGYFRIRRLDDPRLRLPDAASTPRFANDDEALAHVMTQANSGSLWHAAAVEIHVAKILAPGFDGQ